MNQKNPERKISRRKFFNGLFALTGTLLPLYSYAAENTNIPPGGPGTIVIDPNKPGMIGGGSPPGGPGGGDVENLPSLKELKYTLEDFLKGYTRMSGAAWISQDIKEKIEKKWIEYSEELRIKLCDIYTNPDEAAKKYLRGEDLRKFYEFRNSYRSLDRKLDSIDFYRNRRSGNHMETPFPMFKRNYSPDKIKKEYENLYPWIDLSLSFRGLSDSELLLFYLDDKKENRIDFRRIKEIDRKTPYKRIIIVD